MQACNSLKRTALRNSCRALPLQSSLQSSFSKVATSRFLIISRRANFRKIPIRVTEFSSYFTKECFNHRRCPDNFENLGKPTGSICGGVSFSYTRFFTNNTLISNTRVKLAKIQATAKQRLNFSYLKITHTFHTRYHPNIIAHILKNKQKNKCICVH